MTDLRRERRLLRLLQLLARTGALLRDTGDPATVLLELEGGRAVRCASADIDRMRRDGLAGEADGRIVLTQEGRAKLRRGEAGAFADQHRQVSRMAVRHETGMETVTVNDDESPLTVLRRLKRPDGGPWIDNAETAAGERLRLDFETAMLQPRVTASWDFSRVARPSGGARNAVADLSDRALGARERVAEAIKAVGPDLGGALLDVCCFLKGLEQVERERGWPRRSAKLMLKTALGLLDRHYHPPGSQGRRSRGILHWGGDGYRPAL